MRTTNTSPLSQRFVQGACLLALFLSAVNPARDNESQIEPQQWHTNMTASLTATDKVTLFLQEIFNKYGKDDVMSIDGFEHLLESIGLGTVLINDHDVHDHYTKDGFTDLHPDHEHNTSATELEGVDTAVQDVAVSGRVAEGASGKVIEEESKELEDDHHHRHRRSFSSSFSSSSGNSLLESSSIYIDERGKIEKKSLNKDSKKCMSAVEFMGIARVHLNLGINRDAFVALCPAIIYQLDEHVCHRHDPCHAQHANKDWHCGRYHGDGSGGLRGSNNNNNKNNTNESRTFYDVSPRIWGMALASVVVISLCGLCGVAIIPIMDKLFYNQLLQFLIALAVGTLTGDALLHLLPHAMSPHHEADEYSAVNGDSKQPVWTGLSAIAGLFGFFLVEQFVALYGKIKRQRQARRTTRDKSAELGRRLSSGDKRRSRDQGDVLPIGQNQNYLELQQPLKVSTEERAELEEEHNHNKPFHHEDQAHNKHGHGHSHSVPTSVSSAAWMVIMGDGLHNFTDGLAIGASFASSLAVGLSTSLAVFCHELPHELGDFAVLLKSGMSVRQALVYNIVSSLLCIVGMVIGVLVGHIESATSWIFTVTAGIFIYIALVDMLPEMTSTLAHAGDKGGPQKQLQYLILHSCGIAVGVGVMLLIALYEESIQLSIDGSP